MNPYGSAAAFAKKEFQGAGETPALGMQLRIVSVARGNVKRRCSRAATIALQLIAFALMAQNQAGFVFIVDETHDDGKSRPQNALDICACTITRAKPNNL
jgi:hypothetical protein